MDVEILLDKICRDNEIDHLLTVRRLCTATGKIERFHKPLRTEFLMERKFDNFDHVQSELDEVVNIYNTAQPHQSFDMQTPTATFAESTPELKKVPVAQVTTTSGTWAARQIVGVMTLSCLLGSKSTWPSIA